MISLYLNSFIYKKKNRQLTINMKNPDKSHTESTKSMHTFLHIFVIMDKLSYYIFI